MKQEKEEKGLISVLITMKLINKARLFNKRNDTLDGMATTHLTVILTHIPQMFMFTN
uniref:Uncharacterized protein n=1 Tax=Solanum tuberosum TaxID=4113 RepID=M1BGL3_SOLTU